LIDQINVDLTPIIFESVCRLLLKVFTEYW
jgi:hypothetical protein